MMESPPASSDHGDEAFDPSRPFSGVVVCCTSIPTDHRSTIARKTDELGGIHKHDLTPDVTHLIVGEYDTPKYRHVAKERPDIKPMAVGWVDAVRNLWVSDEQIDFEALEEQWCLKTFETGGGALDKDQVAEPKNTLLCCLTGFNDPNERQQIIDTIKSNGGDYTGDLSRFVTHLIVHKPEGKKYLAARNWNLNVVGLRWVYDCVQRGMILDEKLYDPLLPKEEIGKGAWNKRASAVRRISLGKRQRDAAAVAKQEQGRRKLRKTASMKLNSQRDNMWGEILGQPSAAQSASHQIGEPTQPAPSDSLLRSNASISRASESVDTGRPSFIGIENKGDTIFASCCLYAFGFSPQQTEVLVNTVSSLGGLAVGSLADVIASEGMVRRFVIVPQSADQKSLPLLPDGVHLITECFIERCLHRRVLLDPKDHIIGRPFPVFPIPGFEKLSICTAGFTDVDLLQVDKAIRQIGARFEERFNAECSLLLCASLGAVRKQKLDLALFWNIPVVKAEWLWACITQGKRLSTKQFLFPELKSKAITKTTAASNPLNRSKSTSDMTNKLIPKSLPERTERSSRTSLPGPDTSAFDPTPLVSTEPPISRPQASTRPDSDAVTEFETAPTHQARDKAPSQRPSSRPSSRNSSHPLADTSASDLNKTSAKDPPPSSSRKALARVRSEVCDSEAGDEEGFGPTNDDNHTAPTVTDPGADMAELEERRRERDKADKAEAERLALSSKLTSLLGGPPPANPAADSSAAALAAASREDARPASRRKRDVIGRAISNVSMASTASANSTSAGLGRSAAAMHGEDNGSSQGEGGSGPGAVPTATQIEYDDPEAKISKERLMSKMLGRGAVLGAAGGDRVHSVASNKPKTAPVPSGRAAGGRSMRRR